MNCFKCNSPVTDKTAWHQVCGWEQPRAGGGTNSLTFRKRTGRVACNACIASEKSKRDSKVHPGQGTFG